MFGYSELCHPIALTRLSESEQIEYKEYVPGREGPDQWHKDQTRGIGEYGRDKLLAEIIAFANTHGGHLIIGIEESSDKPRRAVATNPLPSCIDLADRLRQAAFASIEPRLANFLIKGVLLDPNGSGVVVVRVSQSAAAPHRLVSKQSETARHCYVRRGDSSEALTMREIQDLTLNVTRGFDALEQKMERFRRQFAIAVPTNELLTNFNTVGVRCSAVPIQDLLLNRGQLDEVVSKGIKRSFVVTSQPGQQEQLQIPVHGHNMRPILRGLAIYNKSGNLFYEHTLQANGSQSITFTVKGGRDQQGQLTQPTHLYLSWVLGVAASMLNALQQASLSTQSPAVEFALELQVSSQEAPIPFRFGDTEGRTQYDDDCILLPQYSFIPEDGPVPILNQLKADLWNTLDFEHTDPIASIKPA